MNKDKQRSFRPGYEYLVVYMLGRVIYDLTVNFCQKFLKNPNDPKYPNFRQTEQMEQAARSIPQNIAEGATQPSLKGYIKLAGIARGSNEELTKDYEDFLRQRNLPLWQKNHPKVREFRKFRVFWVGKNSLNSPKLPGSPTSSTSKYTLSFDGDYLKLTTKSSSDWGSSEYDGKLKEGKHSWTITAYDNAGNTVSSSKTFYVDFTSPTLSVSVDSLGEADGYQVVSNLKPTLSGTLADNYKVDKIDFSFYKQNFFLGIETSRTLYTLETINYTGSTSTSWSFSFTPSQHLDYGKYYLEVKGYDKAGNGSTALTINLQVLTSDKAATLLTKTTSKEQKTEIVEKIREKTKVSLPELEKKAKLRRIKEAENLKTQMSNLKATVQNLKLAALNIFSKSKSLAQNTLTSLTLSLTSKTTKTLSSVSTTLHRVVENTSFTIANTYSSIADAAPRVVGKGLRVIGGAVSYTASSAGKGLTTANNSLASATLQAEEKIQENIKKTTENTTVAINRIATTFDNANSRLALSRERVKEGIAANWKDKGKALKHLQGFALKTGEAAQLAYRSVQQPAAKTANFLYRGKVALNTAYAILFDPNPTKIDNVYIERLGKDYVVISWETNHYTKNNKVNYGRDLTYGKSAWSQDYAKRHVVKITGLEPGQKYYFEVMSQNKNYVYDAYYSFETVQEK